MVKSVKQDLKCVQLNLHKSKAATQQLVLNMETDDIDCALVQEPHCYKGSLPGYPSSYRLYYDSNSDIVKAAIIVRSHNLITFLDCKNTDYNMVSLDVSIGTSAFTLFSYYFEPSRNVDLDLHKISQAFLNKNLNRLVWCMDANSKSELWFSPYSDTRGNKLSDFISANNLFVVNEDCGPTFRSTRGSSYIDITAVGSELLQDIVCWGLSENESLSDHMMIEFGFCVVNDQWDKSEPPFKIFNTKKANWYRFQRLCYPHVGRLLDTLDHCSDSSCLNTIVEELSSVIFQASLSSMPVKRCGMHNVPWWSKEIGCMRKRLNAFRRRFQRSNNPILKHLYRLKYLEYKKEYSRMLTNAKSDSWKHFLSTIDVHNVWKKVYTHGVKKDFMRKLEISGIVLPTGRSTTSSSETVVAVLEKAFPSDPVQDDTDFHREVRDSAKDPFLSFQDTTFTLDEVNTVIGRLQSNKTPGPDSISNEIVKRFHSMFPSFLQKLFNACLNIGAFPSAWKCAQVVLIPKGTECRIPHLDNLRCISLLPALGKCLEKLFIDRINWYLRGINFLSSNQYGFTPQKSTEDALLRLNDIVQRGKTKNLHTIMVFLDIKGAFDNAWWPCILNILKKANLPMNIFYLAADFLKNRIAKLKLGSSSVTHRLQRGCPQGSVSGPTFWNIIVNDLLVSLEGFASCNAIAFADDILICLQGRDFPLTFSRAQEALDFISSWSKDFKLEFNPNKSKVMFVEKRNSSYDNYHLFLDGSALAVVKQMKYLGVILDSKFCWKGHLSYISEKCDKLQRGLSRISRNTYGINFNVHSLVYKQAIEPFLLYGSVVWGTALKKKINTKHIRRIQRRILLRVISGYRTVSYESTFAISGFSPIDILIKQNISLGEKLSSSSISGLNRIVPLTDLPHPSERNAINIIDFNPSVEEFPVYCYTDGSKIDGKVGFAFVVFRGGIEFEYLQFRIPDECTVFIAELLCLNFAINWVIEQNNNILYYIICTDSLSSLGILRHISSSNSIVVDIQTKLKYLKNKNVSVDFAFVRGHTGIHGNERADFLAKAATKRKIDIFVNKPKSFFKRSVKENVVKTWNAEYIASTKGNVTKKFFPSIERRLVNHHFATNFKMTQFLTGHGKFNSYLQRFNLSQTPLCDCKIGGIQDPDHIILNCYKYNNERNILIRELQRIGFGWPPRFPQLMSDGAAFQLFKGFIRDIQL